MTSWDEVRRNISALNMPEDERERAFEWIRNEISAGTTPPDAIFNYDFWGWRIMWGNPDDRPAILRLTQGSKDA